MSTEAELAAAIESAAATAIARLFQEHPGRFYYLSLITTGEAHSPVLSAWSEEALERSVRNAADPSTARSNLKWSYADSPYFCFGEEHFADVARMFDARPDIASLDDAGWDAEFCVRLGAMEAAMAALDRRGSFGIGTVRLEIVINVEVMPPDETNTMRAMRLNPADALQSWLSEAAEPL